MQPTGSRDKLCNRQDDDLQDCIVNPTHIRALFLPGLSLRYIVVITKFVHVGLRLHSGVHSRTEIDPVATPSVFASFK